jgi:predicted DNA-binding transcriptional regulator AlpA
MRLNKIIRACDVDAFCGIKRTLRIEQERKGQFPRALPLSDGGRAKGYLESELIEWQRARLAKRDQEPAAS